MSPFRASPAAILALTLLWPLSPSQAQQNMAPAAQQAAAQPAPSAINSSIPAPVAAEAPTADAGRSLKQAATGLRELSPWSMFLSADVLVKAVMVGLAFASLATWTIFIAKMIELSLVQRRLR